MARSAAARTASSACVPWERPSPMKIAPAPAWAKATAAARRRSASTPATAASAATSTPASDASRAGEALGVAGDEVGVLQLRRRGCASSSPGGRPGRCRASVRGGILALSASSVLRGSTTMTGRFFRSARMTVKRQHRVALGEVGPQHQDGVGGFQVEARVGHGIHTEGLGEGLLGGGQVGDGRWNRRCSSRRTVRMSFCTR